jgi:spoIIIJ-associated protein
MSEYQEFTGKSVEDAIRQAREAFGVAGLEDLDFEILTPGSRGVLGMGAEPARILAAPRTALGGETPKRAAAAAQPIPAVPHEHRERGPQGDRPQRDARFERGRGPARDERRGGPRGADVEPPAPATDLPAGTEGGEAPAPETGPRGGRETGRPSGRGADRARGGERRTAGLSAHEQEEVTAARATRRPSHDDALAVDASPEALEAGREILEQLMSLLGYDVTVSVATGITSKLNVTAEGSEKEALGALIGRKGERLSALQHLVNLMLSRRMGGWTRVLVDVEDYRGRRERQLTELAHQAADHVVESGKMLQLEPMPALERRWVHLALRDHPGVVTQSIGEEPARRIVILRREG